MIILLERSTQTSFVTREVYSDSRNRTTRPRREESLARFAKATESDMAEQGRCHQFLIHDPKQRLVTAPCFEERVLHHAIMNVCEPHFDRWLISDTYACRTGKGREAAVLRAQHFAQQSEAFLKLDMRHYFASIDRGVLLAHLARRFKDQRLLQLFERILHAHGETGVGLPIGSLTSQHFANFHLSWFDRFVKEDLRCSGYVRYMDDVLIWGKSPRELRDIRDRCVMFLARELHLTPKPPFINRSSLGAEFLGCRVFPTHVILSRRARVRFRRQLTRLEADFASGLIDERELQQRATALVAFTRAAGALSWLFRQAVLQAHR